MIKINIPKYSFIKFLRKNIFLSLFVDAWIIIELFIQELIGNKLSFFMESLRDNYMFFVIVLIFFILCTFFQVNEKLEFMYDDKEIIIRKNSRKYKILITDIISIDLDSFGYERIGLNVLKITYKDNSKRKTISCILRAQDAFDIQQKFKNTF
jgi:hypothetical protein